MAKIFKVTNAKPKDFEEILECLGGFGNFQAFVLVLLLFMEIPAAFISTIPIFVGRTPDLDLWVCDGVSLSPSELCNCNGTLSGPPTSFVSEWGLICGAAWVSDLLTSLQMAGLLVGNIYTSQFSDWYGRRYTFLGTCLLLFTGSVVSAVAPNPYIYGAARFLCGAGFSGYLGLTAIYTIEFLPAKWRKLGGSVGPYGEATMLFALIAYFVQPWRTLMWISAAPIAGVAIIFPLLPESPRWLLRNQRVEESWKILKFVARLNGKPEIELAILKEIALKEQGVNTPSNEIDKPKEGNEDPKDEIKNPQKDKKQKVKRFSYLDFFRYKELRFTTICLMVLWSSWSLSYFGLTYNIKNLPGNLYVNVMYLGLADALGFPAFLPIANTLGRRCSVVFFTTICSTFLVVIAIMFLTVDTTAYPITILVLTILAKFGTAGSRSALRCLTGESFPTAIRSMGTGMSASASGITGFLAPQLVYLGSKWPSVPFFVLAVLSVCGSLFSFLMKETTGVPLSDEIIRRISISPIVPAKETKTVEEDEKV